MNSILIDSDLQQKIEQRIDQIKTITADLCSMVLEIQAGDLGIQTKSNYMDLVTKADLECENKLKKFISQHFPKDEILAEESGQINRESASGFSWILDPIDGTINFAHGLPLFSISIGIAWQGKPVGGLILMPALKDEYQAIIGLGAKKNGQQINISTNTDFTKSLVVTGFPYSRKKYMTELLAGIQNILDIARGIRRTGAATVDLCWLAEGRFDAYYELHLNAWDTCAGAIILTEAGGIITNYKGGTWDMFDRNLAASNGHIHTDLLACLTPLCDLDERE